MDGIHPSGEWYGLPADTPDFTRARAFALDPPRGHG